MPHLELNQPRGLEKNTTAAKLGQRYSGEALSFTADGSALDHVVGRARNDFCAEAHASTLNRSTNFQPSRAVRSLLQLQRQCGNRHVGRVLDMTRRRIEPHSALAQTGQSHLGLGEPQGLLAPSPDAGPGDAIERQNDGGVPDGGAPTRHACVVKEALPANQPSVTLTSGLVFSQINTDILWKPKSADNPGCDPSCGEYRQYVKGHALANGKPISPGLCDGATLQETVYQEDATGKGNCYGRRDRGGWALDVFDTPDRATGSHYHGSDQPNITGPPGTMVDWDLTFKVQSYDQCLDQFGPIHEFPVKYKGPL